MDIIDALCKSVESFGIGKNEKKFETDLDILLNKMNTIEIADGDEEWEILQSNYSKLKYLYDIVHFYNIALEGKFMESLDKFMVIIDKRTRYYLKEIEWTEESYIIKETLEESLNQNKALKKLSVLLRAYKLLINVAEEIRNEKHENHLEYDFLEQFEPVLKRQR